MKLEAKVREFDDGKGMLAFADIVIDNAFVIKGLKVRGGENGTYVSMPSKKLNKPYTDKNGNEKTYEDTFFPITAGARQELINVVLDEYNSSLGTVEEEIDEDDMPF